jgi:hypothetical protein
MRNFTWCLSLLSLVLLAPIVRSQENAKKEPPSLSRDEQKAALRAMAVGQVKRVLSRYLQEHQYSVVVDFDLPENTQLGIDVPYAPAPIVPEAFQGASEIELLGRLPNMQITLLIPDYIDRATQDTLRGLVEQSLPLEKGKNLQIATRPVKLNIQDPVRQAPVPAMAPAGMSSTTNPEALSQALEEIKTLKADLQKLQTQGAGTIAPAEAQTPAQIPVPTSSVEFIKAHPFITGLGLLALYGALFLLALVPSRLLSGALQGFSGAFNAIAKSVKGLADSVTQSSESRGRDNAGDAPTTATASIGSVATTGRESVRDIDPQVVRERIERLRQHYTSEADNLAFEFLCSLLNSGDSVAKAPIFLELFDEVTARRIFQRLSEELKQTLLQILRDPPSLDKSAVALELIDAFETKMAAREWKGLTDMHLSREVQGQLSVIKADELLKLAQSLSEAGVRRLLLYLNPKTIVQFLQSDRPEADRIRYLVYQVASMPHALLDADSDYEILDCLKNFLTSKSSDHYQFYLATYLSIVESAGEGLDDSVIDALSKAHPEVGSYLRRHVMTLGSFFRLPPHLKSDALQGFTNSELALLLASYDDESVRKLIYDAMDKRRRELVEEAVEMLRDENKVALAENQKRVKSKLTQALRRMQKNGQLHEQDMADVELNKDDSAMSAA